MDSLQHPYRPKPVKFDDEPQAQIRLIYSPYGERPGARVAVAITNELDRWITCEVVRVEVNDVHVKRWDS